MRILIVEDEKYLAEALAQILSEEKYLIDIANNGTDGYTYAADAEYDVIILDVMLPGMSGFDIVKKLRQNKISTPVLMLTARDSVRDKVEGLDSGADDYLTKPFDTNELLARVRALSRRIGDVQYEKIEYHDLILDTGNYDLSCGEKSVHLGFKEYELIKILMSNPNITVSKDDLIIKIWGYDSEAVDNNVEAYISFLRKKLIYLKSKVTINTLRKFGYKLEYKKD